MIQARTWAMVVWACVASSCGSAAAPEPREADATSGDEASAEIPSPPSAWAEMSHEEQAAWMFAEVVPRMEARFAAFDAERYAGFGCGTCHGAGARERGFEMPSASLPALYPTGTPEQRQMVREYPEMVRFMFNDVVPTVQTLVGAPDFDEATGGGFSCYSCHPHAGDEGTTPVRLAPPEGDDAEEADDAETPTP